MYGTAFVQSFLLFNEKCKNMRSIFLLLLSCCITAAVSAQNVTIKFNGANKNRNYEVVLDGTSYYSANPNGTSTTTNNSVVLNNLQPGTHNLKVYRLKNSGTRRANSSAVYTKDFVLRSDYDMNINVNGNGQIAFAESRIRNRNRNGNVYNNGTQGSTGVAISTYDYNQLLQNVSGTTSASNRYNAVYNALSTGNYTYTSAQVRQLLSLINSETDRLYLAKQGYARVSDPTYYSVVYDLFPSVNARNELNAFVVNRGGINSNIGTDVYTRVAMSDADFTQIYNNAQSSWFQSGKVSAVRDAFNNTGYIFSTAQVRQLLGLVNAESDRLALAKLAYARTADPANFTALYDMLPSQASKNDLDYYVRNNGNVLMSGSATASVSAVTDATFSDFLFNLKFKLFRSAKVSAVKDFINTSGNYFTVAQVKELVGVGSAESDKIDIAKLAYKKTVDPVNYQQVIDLIPGANGKADVTAYVNANR
jgi:hypothetical protein